MKKVIKNNRIFVNHPRLGWLMLGSWGWEQVRRPF